MGVADTPFEAKELSKATGWPVGKTTAHLRQCRAAIRTYYCPQKRGQRPSDARQAFRAAMRRLSQLPDHVLAYLLRESERKPTDT